MKINKFITLTVIALSLFIIIIFSSISTYHWNVFVKDLQLSRTESIKNLVQANLNNKKILLIESSNLIQQNGDLASSYILSEETNDYDILKHQISRLQKNNPRVKIQISSLKKDIKSNQYIQSKQGLRIIYNSTLYHFSNPVAHLKLSTLIKDETLKKLMTITSSKINLSLAKDPKSSLKKKLKIKINLNKNSLINIGSQLSNAFIITGIISLILMGLFFYLMINKGLIKPLLYITDHLQTQSIKLTRGYMPSNLKFLKSPFKEIQVIHETTNQLNYNLITFKNIIKDKTIESANKDKKVALIEMAQQVAHDIRSPLSALKISLQLNERAKKFDESKQLLAQSIQRINDIANDLLIKTNNDSSDESVQIIADPIRTKEKLMIAPLLDSIISEKRLEFYNKKEISLKWSLDQSAYGLFTKLDEIDSKRMFSNIINNSIEALPEKGDIHIKLKNKNTYIVLEIKDNGKGIPPHILTKVTDRGFSHKKPKGSGLGLSHAHELMTKLGGSLEISSIPNKGTTISLFFPQCSPADWYTPEINIKNQTVVIIDDDKNWHSIWKTRLNELKKDLKIIHFSHTSDFETYVNSNSTYNHLFLVDYNFEKENLNGLELIKNLKIQNQSLLVTNDYYKFEVTKEALNLDIQILPKIYINLIPFSA